MNDVAWNMFFNTLFFMIVFPSGKFAVVTGDHDLLPSQCWVGLGFVVLSRVVLSCVVHCCVSQ